MKRLKSQFKLKRDIISKGVIGDPGEIIFLDFNDVEGPGVHLVSGGVEEICEDALCGNGLVLHLHHLSLCVKQGDRQKG